MTAMCLLRVFGILRICRRGASPRVTAPGKSRVQPALPWELRGWGSHRRLSAWPSRSCPGAGAGSRERLPLPRARGRGPATAQPPAPRPTALGLGSTGRSPATVPQPGLPLRCRHCVWLKLLGPGGAPGGLQGSPLSHRPGSWNMNCPAVTLGLRVQSGPARAFRGPGSGSSPTGSPGARPRSCSSNCQKTFSGTVTHEKREGIFSAPLDEPVTLSEERAMPLIPQPTVGRERAHSVWQAQQDMGERPRLARRASQGATETLGASGEFGTGRGT